MNPKIKELAEKSGFIFWKDEFWGKSGEIDWSCDYTKEFERFAEFLIMACADAADMAREAACKYPGDYVVETLGFGLDEGAAGRRSKE